MQFVDYLARTGLKPSCSFARYLALLKRLVDLSCQRALTEEDGQDLDLISHEVRERTLGHDGLVVVAWKHACVEIVVGTHKADDEVHFTRADFLQ